MKKKIFKLFSGTDLSNILKAEEKILKNKIKKVINKNLKDRREIIESYYKEHYLEPLEFDFNNINKSQYIDRKINMLFNVYCVPFKGDPELLRYNPSGGISGWTLKVYERPGNICFEKETFVNHPEDFKEEIEEIIFVIKEEVEKINRDLKEYNEIIKSYIIK